VIHGLTDSEQQFLQREVVLPLTRAGFRVWCFGSRARGEQQRFSDVDLLVDGPGHSRAVIGEIEEKLVDSHFPYKVDIVAEADLASSYRESVRRERVPLAATP